MSEQRKCGQPATVQYAWGNELKTACIKHANAMAIIGEAIGAPIQAQIITTDKLCEHIDEPEAEAKDE